MNRTSLVVAAAVVAALLLTPSLVRAQLPRDPAERARIIAQILETQARQLTVFDRQGRSVGVVGPRDLYNQPVFSPDATKMAVVRPDLDKETNDLWIIDVASARRTQLTTSETREGANSPTWSPDGKQVAYVALRKGFFSIYRKNADGTGAEELIHQGSFPITLTDWSHDGQYLSYFAADLAGAGLYSLPINGDRKPVEVLRSKFQNLGPRLSPDNRFMAFVSNSSGRNEVYVVPFDPKAAAGSAPTPTQISTDGGTGMTFWRKDGKELFFLAADRSVMSVDVGTGATPFGKPRVLWRPAADILAGIAPGTASVSRDGEKFVLAVPRPQLRQLTVYDRSGKAVTTVAQAGFYNQPHLSPDGTRTVVMRNDPQSGNADIWVVELATGKGIPITNDTFPENAPIWSPDGKQVAYVSTREGISGIYRKNADGTGEAELLFQYTPGAGMVLTDWSSDNKFMTFFTGVVVLVPIGGNEKAAERKEIDWLREDYDAGQGRFSPDNRWIAFLSNEPTRTAARCGSGRSIPNKPEANPGPAVQVTKDGAIGMIVWRQDGKELYYMTRDWEVMAVDVDHDADLQGRAPRKLFQLPGPLPGNPMQWKNVSADGQRFIFAMPSAPAAPAAR